MSVGADVQNTTYSDLRSAKPEGAKAKKKKSRRNLIRHVLQAQGSNKPKPKPSGGY